MASEGLRSATPSALLAGIAPTYGDPALRDGVEVQTGSNPNDPNSFNLARALSSISVTPGNFTLVVNSLRGTASVQGFARAWVPGGKT